MGESGVETVFHGLCWWEPGLARGHVSLVGKDGPVLFLMCPLNLAGGGVHPFSLPPCSNLAFHFPNSLSVLAAFFPFPFPCSLLLSLSILPLAGPHFLPIVTLTPGYLKFQAYNAVLSQ